MTQPSSDIILERMMALHPKIIDLTLDRMWRLLAALDHPERNLPPVIHLAGTNGKGSTQAMIRAGLEAMGKVVHAYTSPHLARFHERIRLAGELREWLARRDVEARLDEVGEGNAGKDAKTRLQEYLQGRQRPLPEYNLLGVQGEDHNQQFQVACRLARPTLVVEGAGSSRRKAEQAAAKTALERLRVNGK